MASVRVSFDRLSVDFIKLIADRVKDASKYPIVKKQVDTMKVYYKTLSDLVDDIDNNLQAHRFQALNQGAMIKMLTNELEKEMRKNVSRVLEQPKEEHLKAIRKRYKSGEPNVIAKASEFYFLTDEQVKYILNE